MRIAPLGLVALLACAAPTRREDVLLPEGTGDVRIQEACAVTARICTRCHELNRIAVAQLHSPREWQDLVQRMRLMPSSNITTEGAQEATRCLVHRAYGNAGLAQLTVQEDKP